MKKTVTIAIFIGLTYLHLSSLKFIPGTFGDEALVGVQAYQILHGDWSGFVNPFYNRHFEYVIGALPVHTTAPFVALFGLNDFTIRLAPAAFGILSLILLYGVMGKLKLGWFPRIYAILLYSFSPIFFHVSHTNFGHSFSLFFLLLGYYFYLLSADSRTFPWSMLSGLMLGIAIYGYLGFSIAIPVFLSGIIISEIIRFRLKLKKYLSLFVMLVFFALASTPQIYMVFTSKDFTKRLIQKNLNGTGFFTMRKLIEMARLYPRYYSKEVVFETAEVDLPGGFVSRHSVRGNGLFLPISAVLILLSIITLPNFFPFYWLFLLFPFPDLITAGGSNPPYPLALYTTAYFLPFISAFALDKWSKILNKRKVFLTTCWTVLSVITLSQATDFLIDYQTYKLYSADYWGWQTGAKEITGYFIDHQNEYDELILHSAFNGPEALIPFYDHERKCLKCKLGGVMDYSSEKKQLFAFRVGEINKAIGERPELNLVFTPQFNVFLPNGSTEYIIGIFKSKKI